VVQFGARLRSNLQLRLSEGQEQRLKELLEGMGVGTSACFLGGRVWRAPHLNRSYSFLHHFLVPKKSGWRAVSVTAAVVLWNTVYLGRAIDALRTRGERVGADDLATLSPLGWEHVNITGDYVWEDQTKLDPDGFRPLVMPD
jgi:Tn3 transposase DDE domain